MTDPLTPAELVKELRKCAAAFGRFRNGSVKQAACIQAAEEIERLSEWRAAVLDAAVINCCDTDENDPRKAVNILLAWESRIALDPAVSKEAAELHAEIERLHADLVALTDATEAWRLQNDYAGPATGDDMVDRLRGIYVTRINDGAGPLNGKETFERRFFTGGLQHEAAARIEKLEHEAKELRIRMEIRDKAEAVHRSLTDTLRAENERLKEELAKREVEG